MIKCREAHDPNVCAAAEKKRKARRLKKFAQTPPATASNASPSKPLGEYNSQELFSFELGKESFSKVNRILDLLAVECRGMDLLIPYHSQFGKIGDVVLTEHACPHGLL